MIKIYESALISTLSKSELEKIFRNHGFSKLASDDENIMRFSKHSSMVNGKSVIATAEYDDLKKSYTLTLGTNDSDIDFAYISDEIKNKSDIDDWFGHRYRTILSKMANSQ